MPITLQAQSLSITAYNGILDSRNPLGLPDNSPPEWDAPSTAINIAAGAVVSIASYATDPDGDAITFSRAVGGTAPAGITVQSNGTITVPTDVPPGTYTILVEADDGRG